MASRRAHPSRADQISDVRSIRIFISSPGDLLPERETAKRVVDELNRSPAFRSRFKVDLYAYEDSAPAQAGLDPQMVVEKYLLRPEKADVVICMFWLRMGTPQPIVNPETNEPYQSGTEYEFLSAYRRSIESDEPRLLLYRCTRPPKDMKTFDAEQYGAVQRFFARFHGASADLKGLLGEFKDRRSFKDILRRDLEHVLDQRWKADIQPSDLPRRRAIHFLPNGLPAWYIKRPKALESLRTAILRSTIDPNVVSVTAVHGMGGIGKTTLARAICDDAAVRAAFPDGILWATLGQHADPTRLQRDWIHVLGGDLSAVSSQESGKVELQQLLQDKAMLLVLDDVWHAADVEALRVGGPECRVLLTTRNADQAEGAQPVTLDFMREAESRALLDILCGDTLTDRHQTGDIATRLGHLPLALKIVGSLLRRGRSWADIDLALSNEGLDAMEDARNSVSNAMAASYNALAPNEQARYRELAIFPVDEPLTDPVVNRLWGQTGGLKPYQTRNLLADLRARALIQNNNTLHDLQYDYLATLTTPKERQGLHSALVDAYGEAGEWSQLPSDDGLYAWRRLATHLKQAGRGDELANLLLDVSYLQGKIVRLGTQALLADFMLMPDHSLLGKVAGALRLGAHLLERAPRELRNQLVGRLGHLEELHNYPPEAPPFFELVSRTLIAPGGSLVGVWTGHSEPVLACAVSPDGRSALSASRDGTLRLWDIGTGQALRTLRDHQGSVIACAFTPDGEQAISGGEDQVIRLWDLRTGTVVRRYKGHANRINDCCCSDDGKLILSVSDDHRVWLWELASGDSIRIWDQDGCSARACAISPDGKIILAAATDGILRAWDVDGLPNTSPRMLVGHRDWDWVRDCAISPDGTRALSASEDGKVYLWDLTRQEERLRPLLRLVGHRRGVNACAFSPDGRFAVSASQDRTLRVWDLSGSRGNTVREFRGHTEWVFDCAFSPDGTHVLSAGEDQVLRWWDILAEPPQGDVTSEGHQGAVVACTFTTDGRYAVSSSRDNSLRLWNVDTMRVERTMEGSTKNKEGWMNDCAVSPDSSTILSACRDQTLQVWDLATGELLGVLGAHEDWVRTCAFSPDGRLAVSGGDDRLLKVWHLPQPMTLVGGPKREDSTLKGHTGWIQACAFSPNGTLLISASNDATVRVWDIGTGEETHALAGHKDAVLCCAFHPDGRSLVLSGSKDRTLRLWDIGFTTGRLIRTFEGHTADVIGCLFCPNTELAISASADHTLRLWEIGSGRELARWTVDAPLECCAMLPDSNLILAGDRFAHLHFLKLHLL